MKVFAHRGASGEFPENTILAFKKAILQGCDGIELDVQYHPSGELILSHDSHILNAAQQPNKLQNIPINELLTLPAGPGEFITTLSKALFCIDGQCDLNIEIKAAYVEQNDIRVISEKISTTIKHSIQQGNFKLNQFIISSFNHYIIKEINNVLPEIRTVALLRGLERI